jgi:GNAT superfamily N-acetyltransferase
MLVADPYQHRGLGTEFLKNMVTIARAEGIKKLWAEIRQGKQRNAPHFRTVGVPPHLVHGRHRPRPPRIVIRASDDAWYAAWRDARAPPHD